MDARFYELLWGTLDFDWAFKPEDGRSGGILSFWNKVVICKSDEMVENGLLCVKGVWKSTNQACGIINVYYPCRLNKKRVLWRNVEQWMNQDKGICWCLAGDFNAVRNKSERRGSAAYSTQAKNIAFDNFIEHNNLGDLPLIGREYTWYKRDASSMCRIDRFFLLEEWMQIWGNLTQHTSPRFVSDHCPLILKQSDADWGPRPFRVMDCWHEHPDFAKFVKNTWESMKIEGLAGFGLKEKLKKLKSALKEWNKVVFGNLDQNINNGVE